MPAQRSGAAPARSRLEGTRRTKLLIDDDAIGVAAIGDAPEVLVGRIVGERHVRAELLKAVPAMGAGVVRVDHAADRDEVAGLVLGNRRADLGDPADDLMAGDTGIDRGHDITPLVTNLMKIGVADAAEENLDLHVAVGRIAPRDRVVGERRCLTGSGVGFRVVCVVHSFVLLLVSFRR